MAVDCIQVPMSEMVWPAKNRRKLRWASERPISRQPCRGGGRLGGSTSADFDSFMPCDALLALSSQAGRNLTDAHASCQERIPEGRRRSAAARDSDVRKKRRRPEPAG